MREAELQAKVVELEDLAKNKVAKFWLLVSCGVGFVLGFIVKATIF